MDTKKTSAPAPASGLVHVNVRLTTRYTVISNDVALHRTLSLTAKGLHAYLQALPPGASVGIKAIAAVHAESELRVAAALRQLEAAGCLKRTRERLPDGRFVPRTISYNRPGAEPDPVRKTGKPVGARNPKDKPEPPPRSEPPEPSDPPARPHPLPPPPPPLAERDHPAATLLASLRVHDPRLLLGERDIARLAPDVTVWLDRGAHPEAVLRTLTAALPANLAHPAALLAHRLTTLLPPPLPPTPAPARHGGWMTITSPRSPFPECDDCGRPFRGTPGPDGLCADCREDQARTGAGTAAA
ncbi:helix-turn-helix domain-containing protein [Streptomyces sp. NPDC094032]|uniref:helix-turn-helix domain-containing protein n=1 Tax=Streptomyces sp. NPDC094032 TaxID=3155308 RepID=UPI00331F6AA6